MLHTALTKLVLYSVIKNFHNHKSFMFISTEKNFINNILDSMIQGIIDPKYF